VWYPCNPPGVMGTVLILSFSPDARRGKGGENESVALCSLRLCARCFLFPQSKKPRNPGSPQFGENQTDFLTSSPSSVILNTVEREKPNLKAYGEGK